MGSIITLKKRDAICTPLYNLNFVQFNLLEVVVNTEGNVVTIEACTPSVSIYA